MSPKIIILLILLSFAGLVAFLVLPSRFDALTPSAADIAAAQELRPNNPALAAIYERSCFSCHADVDAQAPLTGHRAAWVPRLKARSMERLVASVQGGYQAMPPMGFCPDCTEIEFRALIAFMAGEVGQ